jgi:hypothetical protein
MDRSTTIRNMSASCLFSYGNYVFSPADWFWAKDKYRLDPSRTRRLSQVEADSGNDGCELIEESG